MPTKTIDLNLLLDPNKAQTGAKKVTRSLEDIQRAAAKTEERMSKLSEVGGRVAVLGAAITAPFLLAMNKYVSTAKETEPVSKRILELSKKWEESQVRLGRITAEFVLPALERGAAILEKMISFAEQNPGVVKAALTIGTTLAVLGGLIATTAQLVKTVATIQGLAAAAGMLSGGGGAVAGGASASGGLAAAVAAGIGLAIPVLITVIGTAIGGSVVMGLVNELAGTHETWADIANTGKMVLQLNKMFFTQIFPKMLSDLGRNIAIGLQNIWKAIESFFRGGQAAGGYADKPGLYRRGEAGREFVLNATSTRAAERIVGGRLSQGSASSYVTNNMTIGSGMTIAQTKRIVSANNRAIIGSLLEL